MADQQDRTVQQEQDAKRRGRKRVANRAVMMRLIVVVPLMFAFGYALVPVYKMICEVTGVNILTTKSDQPGKPKNSQVDASRVVTVEFDVNSRGPFRFKPEKNSLEVHPGELTQVKYEVVNTQDRSVSAQAIDSYAPKLAGNYFRKLECFCFKQQTLGPNERREMPVVFVIDPELPESVKTVTLSYTFFEVGQVAQTK
ncbi:MAG: cytochrome c oxidase assembly protein [Candidatus Protistobacter heckmanni]|nr:cytochrome c oxidase assembly protein [Candidatus Protistobacter heckmanni]